MVTPRRFVWQRIQTSYCARPLQDHAAPAAGRGTDGASGRRRKQTATQASAVSSLQRNNRAIACSRRRNAGEGLQLAEQAVVLSSWIAVLKVGSPRATDQHGITGGYAVRQQQAVGVVGVSRRVEYVEVQLVDAKLLAFVEANGNTFGPGRESWDEVTALFPSGLKRTARWSLTY